MLTQRIFIRGDEGTKGGKISLFCRSNYVGIGG